MQLNRILGPSVTFGLIGSALGVARILAFCRIVPPIAGDRGRADDFTLRAGYLEKLILHFDREVLPSKAAGPSLSVFLAGQILRLLKAKFLVNIAAGMGHNTVELDRAFRMMGSGEITGRAILLRRPSSIQRDTLDLYEKRFWLASDSNFLFDWCYPAVARYPDLRIDLGLSRLKWHLHDDYSHDPLPDDGQTYLRQVSKQENRRAWQDYYALRRRTRGSYPLAAGVEPDAELLDFLGGRPDRLALLHLKYHVANATAVASDPQAYLKAVDWLQERGYLVVQVGRETCPEVLREQGVLSYAESLIASYERDLELFSIASIAVTAGSGIAFIPDCMGVPTVYLDSWHLGMPLASERCVMVPALVEERDSGRTLTLREQLALYWSLEDSGAEIFPGDRYSARNADADEVLAAVKEALSLDPAQPLSALQSRYRDLDPSGLGGLTDARVSQFFLEKHVDLLDEQAATTAARRQISD